MSAPGARWDREIIAAVLHDDGAARHALTEAGFQAADISSRASKLGLSGDFVKKSRLGSARVAIRSCVRCDQNFLSTGAGNRLCSRCHVR